MIPTQRQRGTCLGLAIWLILSQLWSKIRYTVTSDGFQKVATNVAFWLLLVALIAFIYLMTSWECAISNTCYIANADLANWLFGK